jgi:hypothetical protein
MPASSETFASLPPDDRTRDLAVARPNQDQSLPRLSKKSSRSRSSKA